MLVKTKYNIKTINYLGSKLRLLDFIEAEIDNIDPDKGGVCDLFAGSGCVSYRLSKGREVLTSDIQYYSYVLCSALLVPCEIGSTMLATQVEPLEGEELYVKLLAVCSPLVNIEKEALENVCSQDAILILADIIEHGAIMGENNTKSLLGEKTAEVRNNLTKNKIDIANSVCLRHFGGVYFSYQQAIQIDTILSRIKTIPNPQRNIFLSALISTVSDIVNTVGKHFAQPLRPRNKSGKIKTNLGKAISKDRNIDIFETYKKWIDTYLKLPKSSYKHNIMCGDFSETLNHLPANINVVYADPPYTRDHYSRFYHVLETIALCDIPQLSRVKVHGRTHISRGLYRQDRHQSPFCIKSQAIRAFHTLFNLTSSQNKKLILSYSPYDNDSKTHPRVVTIEQLIELAKQYFERVEIKSAGYFVHNKLNSTKNLLVASTQAEILIVCDIPKMVDAN